MAKWRSFRLHHFVSLELSLIGGEERESDGKGDGGGVLRGGMGPVCGRREMGPGWGGRCHSVRKCASHESGCPIDDCDVDAM